MFYLFPFLVILTAFSTKEREPKIDPTVTLRYKPQFPLKAFGPKYCQDNYIKKY